MRGPGVASEVRLIEVGHEAAARERLFLGSPTIRVDGRGQRSSGAVVSAVVVPPTVGAYAGCRLHRRARPSDARFSNGVPGSLVGVAPP